MGNTTEGLIGRSKTARKSKEMEVAKRGSSADFKILCHHVYEYHKGLRSLVLHTMSRAEEELVEQFLTGRKICHTIQRVGPQKINVFFGDPDCVEIVRNFQGKALNKLTDEEDFMLGIMLGYDRMAQCRRFLRRRRNASGGDAE